MNPILEYYEGMKSGKYIVPVRVFKQYAKLAKEVKGTEKYEYDEKKALKPIIFIEKFCRHSKGEWAGQPIQLELFQKAFIAALFGFVDKKTKQRRYKEALLLIARKNGKTTLLAGIAAYMMIADGEGGSEVYSVASKKDQAKICFDETHNMIKQSPELSKHIKKRKTDLYFPATFSKFQPLGKNSDTMDGLNSHLVIFDEAHSVRDRNVYEVMKQSQSARRQPLMVTITTAGTVRECIFDDLYEYACNLVDGNFSDDTFLPVLYELDSQEEYLSEENWIKANPGIDAIKKRDDLRQKVERTQKSPADLAGVLCKDFNIRGSTSTAWLSFQDILNDEVFELEQFRGGYCIGGADLSITTDLTASAILMMDREGKRYVHVMAWLPEDNLEERVQRDKIPYDQWERRGLLRLCSGNTINYSDVTAWFLEIVEKHGITPLWVYYDSYSARYWVEEMKQYGFPMVRCIQGAKTLSLPMQQLGADLKAKRVNYNKNPLLRWCLTNVGIQTDRNGNIVPIKNQSARHRIDAAAALLDSYVGLYEHLEEFARMA